MIDLPPAAPEQAIVVTAARSPVAEPSTAASVTLVDELRTKRIGEPLIASVLRLTPSASLSISGPAGSQTQLRLRGSEANHTLLFVDGIRANDPAAGNEPRFELLNGDLGSRIEVVRGPQSALWGSEAIGGVVAVGGTAEPGTAASAEAGSHGFARLSGSASTRSERIEAAVGGGFQGSAGINSFAGGQGDRDGYRNATGRARLVFRPSPSAEIGAAGFAIAARSEFDGFDPLTFQRADTLDESRNRLGAGRVWASVEASGWTVSGSASLLGSSNRNLLDDEPVNRTNARRLTAGAQLEKEAQTGSVQHHWIAAFDADRETFRARDVGFGGFTNQNRHRSHQAFTAEWRAEAGPLTTDLAIRHDLFSRFRGATTVRGSALLAIGRGFAAAVTYGQGIAQPTFFDLYGFFPGSFEGNPALQPERSRGSEASLRYKGGRFDGAMTAYRQRLSDEIIDVFDPVTLRSMTENAAGRSLRKGIEAEVGFALTTALRLSANYALLEASERTDPEGRSVRELRRPRHSGSVVLDGQKGRFTYGASLAYTGERQDRDFDLFPSALVRLDEYWLAGARLAYEVRPGMQLFGRLANAFDDRARDVVGYRTEGRSAHGGVRLAFSR
ncbi:TonB-dependent receptor domain-containing protein [Sphingomonas sp. GCM10030256]|uniref:TonB-dependent receptor domain-containing protein n=1 Tax=Sphingomonas sp. GCM10030256 TaxID=3273427 RepID=UPI003619198A